jgi:hypothetical protein
MNSRGFLVFRMLIEFIIAICLVIAAVDVSEVHISRYVWVDVPCRLLLAVLAFGIFTDCVRLQRESRVR